MGMEDANVWLVAEESGIRQIMRSLLGAIGFRNVQVGTNKDQLEEIVENENPHVIFTGPKFQDADIYKCIKDIRHGRMGPNPFLPIVSIADNPTQDLLGQVSDAGSDDLLAIPLSHSHIEKRIGSLIDHRKPFVVTSQYIGPDRRKPGSTREGGMQVPLLDVPNNLKAAVSGKYSEEKMALEIMKARDKVDAMRVDRNTEQLMWLTHRILAGYAWADGGELEPEVLTLIGDLMTVADDMMQRSDSAYYTIIRPMCETLLDVSEHLITQREYARDKTLKLLPELAKGIKVGMGDIRGTPDL